MSDRYKGAILSPTAPTVTSQSAGGIYTLSQQTQYQGQGVWPTAVNNPINNSLRFRSSASAYLNRTPASAGNRKTMTYSMWVKRGTLGSIQPRVFGAAQDNYLGFNSDTIEMNLRNGGSASNVFLQTTQVFRDPSAWYHIVMAIDTTQSTASNRVKLYINGVQVTAFSSANYPTQNNDMNSFNNNVAQYIGCFGNPSEFFDGYMTEFYFIDGQALTPSSFGTTDAYGIWQPIPYTGTYGTNGFYLKFTDNSALTTSSNVGLGRDFSGNANYWVTNGISITAGTTYDSMVDVPTNTNSNTANYCVINGLNIGGDCTISQANLTVAYGSNTTRSPMQGTIGMTTGKWYFEAVCTASSVSPTSNLFVGIANKTMPSELGSYTGANASGWGFNSNGGTIYNNGSSTAYGSSASVNDIVGVAFDADTGKLYFSINGTFQNSGNPVTGTNPAYTVSADTYYPSIGDGSGASTLTASMNFGQRPFAYTPPTGFYPLNTYNLPTPTILAGNQYMDASLYTGNGSSVTVTNSGGMQPDLVWGKSRSNAISNYLVDSVRGVSKALSSDRTDAEDNAPGYYVTAFNSNGFNIGLGTGLNTNGATYVGWQWRASNVAGVSNTQGTITSTVSANTTAGFSIVTYTGTGSNATVGHGLGVTPAMVIYKNRSAAAAWIVYHQSLTVAGNYLVLNATSGTSTDTAQLPSVPTSTILNIGTQNNVNGNGNSMVAYCFAQVAGYSAFGSYTGNGSSDGPFVFTGFRPRFFMTKITSAAGYDWIITDTSRDTYNVSGLCLEANLSNAESTNGGAFSSQSDILSNGFKIRNSGTGANGSGGTYIYMAFAENPFKIARGR